MELKKVLAIVLALVMLMGLSVTAFAETASPAADQKITVVSVAYEGAAPKTQTFSAKDQKLTFTAEATRGSDAFAGWKIYKKDGTEAVAGTDYTLADSSALAGTTLVIVPLKDVIVTANYGTTTTSIEQAKAAFTSKSPASGDMAVTGLALIMFVALAGVCVSKKQLAK